MSKLLINDSDKLLVGSNGKAYAVRNLDVLKGSTSPVDFTAAAGRILRLMRYGRCEQNGTPTPSAPADIVCNNGALRYGALGNNLFDPSPSCFKLNYYIETANGTEGYARTNFIYTPHIPVTPGTSYVFYGRKKSGNTISKYNRIAFYAADGTYLSTGTYSVGTIGKGTAPENAAYCILSCNPSGEASATGTQITQEFIDSYNWTFCKGTAEVTPFVPYVGGIYTDGTPEVLTVSGKNLLDPSAVTAKKYINASGQELPSQSPIGWLNHSDYIAVTAGEDYTLSVTGADGGSNTIAFNWFDANKTILATRPTQNVTSGTTAYTFTNTAPADAAYLIVNFITGTKVMVEESSTATDYQPYVQPQTVNDIKMLLGVGDYKDEAELISGIKTGKVGVKVFDGTEDWTAFTSSTLVIQNATSAWGAVAGVGGYCTHLTVLKAGETTFAGSCRFASAFNLYEYKTAFDVAGVAGFKAKIAALYAAGTPVIVIYPLATPTTEQVTPQPLTTEAGQNTLTDTAEVSNPEYNLTYKL